MVNLPRLQSVEMLFPYQLHPWSLLHFLVQPVEYKCS